MEDGRAKVGDEILEKNEFELLYKGKEGENCEADSGFVVVLDTNLTPELELEGKRNDLNRAIQDLRKDSNLEVSDRIILSIQNADEIVNKYSDWLKTETLAQEITTSKIENADGGTEVMSIAIQLKKV